MPDNKVGNPGVVTDRQIILRIYPAPHVHGLGAIGVCRDDVRTHVRDVLKHKAILVVNS